MEGNNTNSERQPSSKLRTPRTSHEDVKSSSKIAPSSSLNKSKIRKQSSSTINKNKYMNSPSSTISENSSLWDPESLYIDEDDKQRLDNMKEFEREAELARRHDEQLRKKQRKLLFKEDSKTDGVSDVRVGASHSVGRPTNDNKSTNRRKSFNSTSSISSLTDGGTESSEDDDEIDDSFVDKNDVGDEENSRNESYRIGKEDRPQQLFIDERKEEEMDIARRRAMYSQVVSDLSLDLVKPLRLNAETIVHILEHPRNEYYLTGCFVKMQPIKNDGIPQLYSITGIKQTDPYMLLNDKVCHHSLYVSISPFSGTLAAELMDLTKVVNSGIATEEWEIWKKKLLGTHPIDGRIEEKLKGKLKDLKSFTFTDEDVEIILKRNKEAASSHSSSEASRLHEMSIMTSSALVRMKMSNQHELDTLMMSYTAEEMESEEHKQKLNELMNTKNYLDNRLNAFNKRAAVVDRHAMTMEKLKMKRNQISTKKLSSEESSSVAFDGNSLSHRECRPTLMWGCNVQKSVGGGVLQSKSKLDKRNIKSNAVHSSDLFSLLEKSIIEQKSFIQRALSLNREHTLSTRLEGNVNTLEASVASPAMNCVQWKEACGVEECSAPSGVQHSMFTLDEYTDMTRVAMASMQMHNNGNAE